MSRTRSPVMEQPEQGLTLAQIRLPPSLRPKPMPSSSSHSPSGMRSMKASYASRGALKSCVWSHWTSNWAAPRPRRMASGARIWWFGGNLLA